MPISPPIPPYDPSNPPSLFVGTTALASDLPWPLNFGSLDDLPSWSSGDGSKATIAGSPQVVTPVGAGTVTLTATGTSGGNPVSGQINVVVFANPATGLSVNLSPSTVFGGQSSTASVTILPPGAGIDPGSLLLAVIGGRAASFTVNPNQTATVVASRFPGIVLVGAKVTSNGTPVEGAGSLTVAQSFTGLQLTNSIPDYGVILGLTDEAPFGVLVPLGKSFTLTPTLLPLGCTAPVDANSWTAVPSKPGNSISIDQTSGIVTVGTSVTGIWTCTVGFTSNGQQFTASATVRVDLAATGMAINVQLSNQLLLAPSSLSLLVGAVAGLTGVATPTLTSELDAAPTWTTSNAGVAALSATSGTHVQLTIAGTLGTATITCSGRSAGNPVSASMTVTALQPATLLIVTLSAQAGVTGVPLAATATTFPGGSSVNGNVQWSYTVLVDGEVQVDAGATMTARITPTAPGTVKIIAQATTPNGIISGSANLTISPSPKDIGLQVTDAVTGVVGFNGGFNGSFFIVNRTGTTHAAALLVPTDAAVDAGSWTINVQDETVLTATINASTGAVAITAVKHFGSTTITVSATSGSGVLITSSALLVYVGDGPVQGDGTLQAFQVAIATFIRWTPTLQTVRTQATAAQAHLAAQQTVIADAECIVAVAEAHAVGAVEFEVLQGAAPTLEGQVQAAALADGVTLTTAELQQTTGYLLSQGAATVAPSPSQINAAVDLTVLMRNPAQLTTTPTNLGQMLRDLNTLLGGPPP